MADRGYYLNSLRAWRSDLLIQLRRESARNGRMADHPDRPDMIRLCDLTREFISRLSAEIEAVERGAGG